MKRVFVDFYGVLNLGDDLFIKILLERYKDTKFVLMLDHKMRVPFYAYENIEFCEPVNKTYLERLLCKISKTMKNRFYRLNLRKTKKILKNEFDSIDGYINIGGSIFIESSNKNLSHDLYHYKLDLLSDKEKFILGANFGPYHSERFKRKFVDIFSKFSDVSFRDLTSFNEFPMLDNIRVNPDIVFSMNKNNKNSKNNEKVVGISVIDLKNRNISEHYDSYFYFILNTIKYWAEMKYTIKIFSFCSFEGDERFITELLEMIPGKYRKFVDVVKYEGVIDTMIEEISSVSIFYATRFHAMILGLIYSDVVIPISYSKKMNNLLNDLDYSGDILEINALSNVCHESLILKNKVDLDISKLRVDAENHFLEIDAFLEK